MFHPQITVPLKGFKETLEALTRTISSKRPEHLKSMDLQVDGQMLRLSVTTAEWDARRQLQAETTPGWQPCQVSAMLLTEVTRTLPGETVTLTQKAEHIELSSGQAEFKLQRHTEPLPCPPFNLISGVEIPLQVFHQATAAVLYAANPTHITPAFRAVLLRVKAGTFTAAASNGFRLACSEHPMFALEDLEALVPVRTLQETLRNLPQEGTVRLASHATQPGVLSLQGPDFDAHLRLIDGTFPDFQHILPKATTTTLTSDSDALRQALERVAVMADARQNHRVQVQVSPDRVLLKTQGEQGQSQESLSVQVEGQDLHFNINAAFLVDALKHSKGHTSLKLLQATDPLVVTPADTPTTYHVISPIP